MIDREAKRAALALLARGLITRAEAAQLAGVSHQLMRHWLRRSGIDHERMRDTRLADLWRKELARRHK
jgi:predicted HTH domain antitoxin